MKLLETVSLPGGMVSAADGTWTPLAWVSDRLGNVREVADMSTGTVVERNDYYAYGSRIEQNPDVINAYPQVDENRWRYAGKEEQEDVTGIPYDDFGARHYDPHLGTWMAPDPLAEKYPGLSPFVYCAGDPVNVVDPDGNRIVGNTRSDATRVVCDLREIFRDDVFSSFRELIVQSGKNHRGRALAKIDKAQLEGAFKDVTLSTDQQALVDIVVNTINSNNTHTVEYANMEDFVSPSAISSFESGLTEAHIDITNTMEGQGGIKGSLLAKFGGGGVTTLSGRGTYTVVLLDGEHPNGRAVTTGHEVLGHGRSLSLGRKGSQHVDAIQAENLLLRVMNIPYQNDGSKHGSAEDQKIVFDPTALPSFR